MTKILICLIGAIILYGCSTTKRLRESNYYIYGDKLGLHVHVTGTDSLLGIIQWNPQYLKGIDSLILRDIQRGE